MSSIDGSEAETLARQMIQTVDDSIKEIRGAIGNVGIGKVTGTARVLMYATDIGKLKEGEILVAPMTTPEFVPAMRKAAAIITDEGGVTCHAAIVSRELKKPCIIGTKVATQVLKDGDEVEVDANLGLVRVISGTQNDALSLLMPENYRFVGLYKCLPFAFWFWAAWYSKERLDALGLSIDFGGYCGVKGGNNLINVRIAEQFKARLLERVESDDMRYFSALESQAAEEFANAVAWAERMDTNNTVTAFKELVEHARDIMFYWFIGWLSSQSIDETLRKHAEKANISADTISSYIAQPDTPLIRQQAEARKLKELLIKKGVWELLKTDSQKAIDNIRGDKELNTLISNHVSQNEWLPIINFVGEKFTMEKLFEQMSFFKDGVDSSHSSSVPKSFEKYARIASHIGYLNQASAEYFSIFSNKIMPFLESIAKRLGISYRELLHLIPNEVAAALEGKLDVSPITARRQNDNWIIYTAPNNEIRVIEDSPTVEAIADKLLPKPDITNTSIIKGQIGNKGKAKGLARIIIATDDFHKMQDGDVLVTPMTTPDFVLLMQKSVAIVTDMGGMLSHAAIVSREMGKPCVIDTKFATKILKDGDLVEIDADKGLVKVIKKAS